jgi:hypothetical protein
MLQAGRPRVQILLSSLDFFFSIDLILPAALWPWGSTQPLTEMSTRILSGGKRRPARKAVSRVSRKCGSLDVSQNYGPPRPVTSIELYLTTDSDYQMRTISDHGSMDFNLNVLREGHKHVTERYARRTLYINRTQHSLLKGYYSITPCAGRTVRLKTL